MPENLTKSTPNIDRYIAYCNNIEHSSKKIVYEEGDESNTLFYIISGSVTVLKRDSTGKEVIIDYLSEGDFFGELGIYSEKGLIRNNNVITKTATVLGEMRYDRFLELARIYPSVLKELDSQMAERLESMSQRVMSLALHDAPERVLNCLHQLCKLPDAKQVEKGVQIKISRMEISKIVGCTRESVGRILQDIEAKGLVSSKGHTFVIHPQK